MLDLNIKDKVDEIVTKAKSDENFFASFKEDPIKAVESVLGVDLPDEMIKSIIDGVKEKLFGKADDAKEEGEGILGKIKNLF